MGYAKFRAVFVGDASNEWSVSPSDGFLKQNEATHFVVRYTPHNSGVSNSYFVIETEVSCGHRHSSFGFVPDSKNLGYTCILYMLLQDFTKTWKVVGSTGEYGF